MFNRGSKGIKNTVILAAIVIFSFILITANIKSSKTPGIFEIVFVGVVSPVQSLVTKTVDSISGIFDHYFFLVDVSRENEILQRQVLKLKAETNELHERIRWHKRVGHLANYEKVSERKGVVATVIGRDASQWSKMVFINKGTQHGLNENLTVMTDKGVVGHTIQVLRNSSKVLLMTDTRSAIDALFQNSRDSGVVVGMGAKECEMKYVSIDLKIKVGEVILSSGLGGVFPKGLKVGRVIQVKKKKQGLFQKITVKPSADLSKLEEVLVLLP